MCRFVSSVLVACLAVFISLAHAARPTIHDDSFQPNVVLRISSINVSIACTTRLSTVVNDTSPGPAVVIPAGQTTWIRVFNDQTDQNATVHWHGLTQSVAPFSDGTPLASQWPIPPGHFFDYELHPTVDEAGSYFYHSHVGFQTVSANGPLIVEEADKKPPIEYDEERYFVLNELYNKTDEAIVDGLIGAPFVWSGEPEALLVNGHSTPVVNASNSLCAPEVFTVEPSKTYRFRMIGAMALTDITYAFANHTDRMNVVAVDGRYTQPVGVDHLQVDSGQRYDVLLTTYSESDLQDKFGGTREFWIQLETRYRPTVVTGYALLRYSIPGYTASDCSTPACYTPGTSRTTLPSSIPSPIPNITALLPAAGDNTTNEWLEYAITPLDTSINSAFPTVDQVTRRVYLSNMQAQLPNKEVPFYVNNHSWSAEPLNSTYASSPAGTPYLVQVYAHGAAAIPQIPRGVTATLRGPNATAPLYTGFDPQLRAYGARVGEVLEIILLNGAGYSGTYDVHPWHAHGGHYYDIGSGPGFYDAAANEAKLERLRRERGFVPALRDSTVLYRWPADNKVNDTEGTVGGWRGWRIRVEDAGVWMIHCHTLQHMVMGMQTVWVMGDAAQVTQASVADEDGFSVYGGDVEHEVVAVRTGKEVYCISHILRHARPPQRNQILTILLDRLALPPALRTPNPLINQLPHLRPHDPGRVRIHRDPMLRHLHRKRLRQPAHRPLGRTVVRQHRERLEPGNRRGADDLVHARRGQRHAAQPQLRGRVAWRLALGNHLARGGGIAVVHTEDIDAEYALEIGLGHVEQRLDLHDAGVGDHGVQWAQGLDGGGDQGVDVGADGDVGGVDDGFAACLLHFGQQGVEAGARWLDVVQAQVVAVVGEALGYGAANALGAAGHDGGGHGWCLRGSFLLRVWKGQCSFTS
ncbi:hypothetical protein FH972_021594 [Carpinus fangiana]|uniref:L-ascorbate oxidase n=1 Tax=Carpinus fangiana TaxID=176857 RepID=A0A5N6KQ48_9ROSI|nr:hypothetical protein FH972_021594 [Carpinus fangiana]